MIKRETVEKALYEMGVSFTGRADTYIVDAIMYIDDNGGLPIKWTAMYYAIGRLRGASPAAVERGIRSLLAKVRATSEKCCEVEKYLSCNHICVSESLGRFYTVLNAENQSNDEEAGIEAPMREADTSQLLRELHEINLSLGVIAHCYKERWR